MPSPMPRRPFTARTRRSGLPCIPPWMQSVFRVSGNGRRSRWQNLSRPNRFQSPRTSPAPSNSLSRQRSTTPQDPPVPETPPEPVVPTPDPVAAPPPVQAPTQDRSRNSASASGRPLILFLVAALALAGAAIVVYAYRPGRSSPTRWKPGNLQSHRPRVSPPVPESLGTLKPEDGTVEIPLRQALLDSSEGLVIGRSASICHVELRDQAVSRRHVRLRFVDETVVVEDLNSVAGTRLDGAALDPFKPQPVFSGQILGIAGRSYSIETASLRS